MTNIAINATQDAIDEAVFCAGTIADMVDEVIKHKTYLPYKIELRFDSDDSEVIEDSDADLSIDGPYVVSSVHVLVYDDMGDVENRLQRDLSEIADACDVYAETRLDYSEVYISVPYHVWTISAYVPIEY